MDPPPVPEEPPARDWSLLPLDALSLVFVKVGAIDVLMGAGLVCRSWLQAAKLPDVWRVVDIENHQIVWDKLISVMAKEAVNRSDGQLQVFAGKWLFVTHELIKYIVERSPSLTTLRLVSCFNVFTEPLASAIRESPLIELRSLDLDSVGHTVGELTDFLENCPVLEVLRVRNCFVVHDGDEHALRSKFPSIKTMTLECDDDFCYDSDFETDDYDFDHLPDFEDQRTDDGSL